MPLTRTIKLDSLVVDQRTQQRDLNPDNITRLEEVLSGGVEFHDPLDVFTDGKAFYLAHGHHRYHAYRNQKHEQAACRVHDGDLEAAIDFSCKPLNSEHGQPETRADRERRVKRMIERHWEWSPRRIAEHCGVSKNTASKYRDESGGQTDHVEGRDGKTYPTTRPKTIINQGGRKYHEGPGGSLVEIKEVVNRKTGEVLDDAEVVTTRHVATHTMSNGKTRMAESERVKQIEALAKTGARSEQIADEIGTTAEYVRVLANRNKIKLPDANIRSQKINPVRVINETVNTLGGVALGVSMFSQSDLSALDRGQVESWVESLDDSLRVINRLRKQLKETIK